MQCCAMFLHSIVGFFHENARFSSYIYMEGHEFKPTYIYEEKDETAESYKAYHKP